MKKPKPYKCPKNKKLAINSGIQTYQVLTNDDKVCIPSFSSILLAVRPTYYTTLNNHCSGNRFKGQHYIEGSKNSRNQSLER